jgi:hypothetical protein
VGIPGRLLTAVVGALISALALTVALALSFAIGLVGVALGVLALLGAPCVTIRFMCASSTSEAALPKRPLLLSSFGTLAIAGGVSAVLGITVMEGDAFNEAWLILMYAATTVGAVLGAFWPSKTNHDRRTREI